MAKYTLVNNWRFKICLLGLVIAITVSGCTSEKIESSGKNEVSIGVNETSGELDRFIQEINADTAEFKGVCGSDSYWYYKDNILWGVERLEDYTLYGCNNLTEIEIAEGVRYIGRSAIYTAKEIKQ